MVHKPVLNSIVIWLSAVIFSPVLFVLMSWIFFQDVSILDLVTFPDFWQYGGFASLPSLLILIIINSILSKLKLPAKTNMIILLLSCTILTWLAFCVFSFFIIGDSLFALDPIFTGMIACYLICLYVSIFSLFFLRKKYNIGHNTSNTNDNGN